MRFLRSNKLGDLYREATGKELEGAHGASADVIAAETVLKWQLTENPSLPRTIRELAEISDPIREGNVDRKGKLILRFGEPTVAFGKYEGAPFMQSVLSDRRYWKWVAEDGEFAREFKAIVADALAGIPPRRSDVSP